MQVSHGPTNNTPVHCPAVTGCKASKKELEKALHTALKFSKKGAGRVVHFFSTIPGLLSGKLLRTGLVMHGKLTFGNDYELHKRWAKLRATITIGLGTLLKETANKVMEATSHNSLLYKAGLSIWKKGLSLEKLGYLQPLQSAFETLKNKQLPENIKKIKIVNCSDRIADLIILAKRQGVHSPISGCTIAKRTAKLYHFAKDDPVLIKAIELKIKIAENLCSVITTKELKTSFNQIVNTLCKKYQITQQDAIEEGLLIEEDPKTAKQKMVKRLLVYLQGKIDPMTCPPSLAKRKAATGYQLSDIKAIEHIVKKAVLDSKPGKKAHITPMTNDFRVIVSGNTVLVEEHEVATGAFKVVRFASDYFKIKKPEERCKYVTLKLAEIKTELETSEPRVNSAKTRSSRTEDLGTKIEYLDVEQKEGDFTNLKNSLSDEPKSFEGQPLDRWSIGALQKELEATSHRYLHASKEDLQAMIEQREKDLLEIESYEIPDDDEDFQKEIEMIKQFQGEGVVKFHSVLELESGEKIVIEEAAGYSFETSDSSKQKKAVFANTLDDMGKLNREGKLNQDQHLVMMRALDDAFLGVERLHSQGYLHRDLKPENILLTKEGRGALTDFGTVCKKEGDPSKGYYHGTPRYSSPESCALVGTELWKTISEKSDVWSCGMILFETALKMDIYQHPAIEGDWGPEATQGHFAFLIKPEGKKLYERKFKEPLATHPSLADSLLHLVWEATKINPDERPTMSEFRQKFNKIRQLPWLF